MKRLWESKTMWIGALEFLAGALLSIAGHLEVGGALTVVGILTVLLRYVTKEEIQL